MPTLYDNFSQVRQYIDENNTSYVSKTELANASYVTSSQLSDCSYATTSYVADYVATYGGGVIDENIVPKKNNTYTLGDSTYRYYTVYSENFMTRNKCSVHSTSDYNIYLKINNADRWTFDTLNLVPNSNNDHNLGSSTYLFAATYTDAVYYNTNNKIYNTTNSGLVVQRAGTDICGFLGGANIGIAPLQSNSKLGNGSMFWQSTYTENLYAHNINLSSDGKHSIKINGNNIRFAYNDVGFYLNNDGFRPGVNGTKTLGTSSAAWGSTYTTKLYLNGTNLEDRFTYLIWTGTAAEYSALADYTTYNLYLIQSE